MNRLHKKITKILVLSLIVGFISVPFRSVSKAKNPYLSLTDINFTNFSRAYSRVRNLKKNQIKKTTAKTTDGNVATAKASKKKLIRINRRSDSGYCRIIVKVILNQKVQNKKSFSFEINVYVNRDSITSTPISSMNPATPGPSYSPFTQSSFNPVITPSVFPYPTPSTAPGSSAIPTSVPSASPQSGAGWNQTLDTNEAAALRNLIKSYGSSKYDDNDVINERYFSSYGENEPNYYDYAFSNGGSYAYDGIVNFSGFHEYCEWENGHVVFLCLMLKNTVSSQDTISFKDFPKLRGLYLWGRCSDNGECNFDISKNNELSDLLIFQYNNSIDLSTSSSLKNLAIENSNIGRLNLPSTLKRFGVFNEATKNIDLTGLTKLANLEVLSLYLDEVETDIESIDLSGNIKLTDLALSLKTPKMIDLSKNINLKNLYMTLYKANSINLTHNEKLENLVLDIPETKSIDLSGNVNLKRLKIMRIGDNITEISLKSQTKLESFILGEEGLDGDNHFQQFYNLKNIDFSNCINLHSLELYNAYLESIDLTNNINLKEMTLLGSETKSIGFSGNKELTSLNLGLDEVKSIDLTHNEKLEHLDLSCPEVESIDLTHNEKLEYLDISLPKANSIDLSCNVNLKGLVIDKFGAGISEINLKNQTKLEDFRFGNDCYGDLLYYNLKNIDLTNCTSLRALSLNKTNLESIDFTNNIMLESAYINNINKNLRIIGLNGTCKLELVN